MQIRTAEKEWDYKSSLKEWLKDDLEFSSINKAEFTNEMVVAIKEFDKDHTIYIVVSKNIFKN